MFVSKSVKLFIIISVPSNRIIDKGKEIVIISLLSIFSIKLYSSISFDNESVSINSLLVLKIDILKLNLFFINFF